MTPQNNEGRRTQIAVTMAGADITEDIQPYLLSLTYTDNEEDESDDLQIDLQDREAIWLTDWLERAVTAAAASRLKISATITPVWESDPPPLPCGEFEIDSVDAASGPRTISIKATALPYSSPIRQTIRTKAWEAYHLSGILSEIAAKDGMTAVYDCKTDPYYKRKEQNKKSDINFLQELCRDAGFSLKATDKQVVCFDQSVYEQKEPVLTIDREAPATFLSYRLSSGSAETQYSKCRVSYTDPATGQAIEGEAVAEETITVVEPEPKKETKSKSKSKSKTKTEETAETEEETGTEQVLEITAKVDSKAEAEELAKKWLRMNNKYSRTASFDLVGNTALVAGVTVLLANFGGWDGKYMVKQAQHKVSPSDGYKTTIELRRIIMEY